MRSGRQKSDNRFYLLSANNGDGFAKMKKKIALLGSTGSIGRQTLNVIRRNPDLFEVVSLAAGNNTELLLSQAAEFSPDVITLKSEAGLKKLNIDLKDGNNYGVKEVYFGSEAYIEAITDEADLVVIALVGFDGLKAVLKAAEKGKDIALANKESLVVGGKFIMDAINSSGIRLNPIDSEHSAIWQCLGFDRATPFKKLILTASGGAFRDKTIEELKTVTAKEALKHPNWNMGDKITVDCATMVNKAFEVIEANRLYNADFSKIEAVMHRESIIHSMVEFCDNSVMAQLSYPSMEIPISLALTDGKRLAQNVDELDFFKIKTLDFEEIDGKKFPCFPIGIEAGRKGGLYPAVFNGANEAANLAFRQGVISYPDIYAIIEGALSSYTVKESVSLESIERANEFAAGFAEKFIKNKLN